MTATLRAQRSLTTPDFPKRSEWSPYPAHRTLDTPGLPLAQAVSWVSRGCSAKTSVRPLVHQPRDRLQCFSGASQAAAQAARVASGLLLIDSNLMHRRHVPTIDLYGVPADRDVGLGCTATAESSGKTLVSPVASKSVVGGCQR